MSFDSIYGNAVRAMLCKGRKKESTILCEKLFFKCGEISGTSRGDNRHEAIMLAVVSDRYLRGNNKSSEFAPYM